MPYEVDTLFEEMKDATFFVRSGQHIKRRSGTMNGEWLYVGAILNGEDVTTLDFDGNNKERMECAERFFANALDAKDMRLRVLEWRNANPHTPLKMKMIS